MKPFLLPPLPSDKSLMKKCCGNICNTVQGEINMRDTHALKYYKGCQVLLEAIVPLIMVSKDTVEYRNALKAIAQLEEIFKK